MMTLLSQFEDIPSEDFEQMVRDCLLHLYEYDFLRGNRLVELLVPEVTGANQVQAFRQIINEMIEKLRPENGMPFYSKQARMYNLLVFRYINRQQPQEVMLHLALSERQFYRDHPKAIQLLSGLLTERLTGIVPTAYAAYTSANPADISIESEVQRVHSQTEYNPISLRTLLDGAVNATQSLASQHHIQVTVNMDNEALIRGVYSGALRQAVLLTLSWLIVHFLDEGTLEINCKIADDNYHLIFRAFGELEFPDQLESALAQQKSLQTLLETIKGRLSVNATSSSDLSIILDLPISQQTILLVDDNPGVIDLFERYLAGRAVRILVASDGEKAVQIARQSHPNMIILDVMLPGTDGWEVLQNLKTHPLTSEIPVLICSVLEASELAVSLGAVGCLSKPPKQEDFLAALAQWQG